MKSLECLEGYLKRSGISKEVIFKLDTIEDGFLLTLHHMRDKLSWVSSFRSCVGFTSSELLGFLLSQKNKGGLLKGYSRASRETRRAYSWYTQSEDRSVMRSHI